MLTDDELDLVETDRLMDAIERRYNEVVIWVRGPHFQTPRGHAARMSCWPRDDIKTLKTARVFLDDWISRAQGGPGVIRPPPTP